MEIMELSQRKDLFNEAVHAFWKQWGNEQNYKFYQDCMLHSCQTTEEIPRFYIALLNQTIIGTYALIRNDLNSRQDLFPWLACLYVSPEHRGKKIGSHLLEHATQEAYKKGYRKFYLTTDLEGYYEKYDWTHTSEAYGISGSSLKVYEKRTK
ncbi:GNAT family N-acetyltransferase [Shimazuella kribbensis]|uniref:GNAT family N-acetyltransferase n=1 Tax=Shimazuella kribbensis TaxID=139808 RepID=UPI00048E68B5|nr:GNAT family N-acetyltransferase [Shimazuella kribbensis]